MNIHDMDINFARGFVEFVCQHGTDRGEIPLKVCIEIRFPTIQSGSKKFKDETKFLIDKLKLFPALFWLRSESYGEMVALTAEVEICDKHCNKQSSCSLGQLCDKLHVCKFYMIGFCRFALPGAKESCYFGHDLHSQHNARVLKMHSMHFLHENLIKAVVKRNRPAIMWPEICRIYNMTRGCERAEKCQQMHICRNYVFGKCTAGIKCSCSHDIFSRQPKTLLDRYRINLQKSPKEVLEEMRQVMDPTLEDGSTGSITSEGSSIRQQKSQAGKLNSGKQKHVETGRAAAERSDDCQAGGIFNPNDRGGTQGGNGKGKQKNIQGEEEDMPDEGRSCHSLPVANADHKDVDGKKRTRRKKQKANMEIDCGNAIVDDENEDDTESIDDTASLPAQKGNMGKGAPRGRGEQRGRGGHRGAREQQGRGRQRGRGGQRGREAHAESQAYGEDEDTKIQPLMDPSWSIMDKFLAEMDSVVEGGLGDMSLEGSQRQRGSYRGGNEQRGSTRGYGFDRGRGSGRGPYRGRGGGSDRGRGPYRGRGGGSYRGQGPYRGRGGGSDRGCGGGSDRGRGGGSDRGRRGGSDRARGGGSDRGRVEGSNRAGGGESDKGRGGGSDRGLGGGTQRDMCGNEREQFREQQREDPKSIESERERGSQNEYRQGGGQSVTRDRSREESKSVPTVDSSLGQRQGSSAPKISPDSGNTRLFSPGSVPREPQPGGVRPKEKTTPAERELLPEVCVHYLRGQCSYGNNCLKYHTIRPFLWQFEKNDKSTGQVKWKNFDDQRNKQVETEFCKPEITLCSLDEDVNEKSRQIDFQSMQMLLSYGHDTAEVRRISTGSSVLARPKQFSTKWLWYWRDDGNVWKEYKQVGGILQEVTSSFLEENYQKNSKDKASFKAANHNYELDFGTMTQKNVKIGTCREVRRRPQNYTVVQLEDDTPRSPGTSEKPRSASGVPEHWDLTPSGDSNFYQLVPIESGWEFSEVERHFLKTMSSYWITKLHRIQNLELWDSYERKKTWMQKRGQNVNEHFLFHGTNKDYVDAICQQGFDWRISGLSSGTAYGKGSYFARDAYYSRSYTNCQKLFVVRVLVGESAKGKSSLTRPPPKDPSKPNENFYDSCVDNVSDPKIFVMFKNEQAYPEYLLEYVARSEDELSLQPTSVRMAVAPSRTSQPPMSYNPQMAQPTSLPTQAPQPTLTPRPMAYNPQMTQPANLPTKATPQFFSSEPMSSYNPQVTKPTSLPTQAPQPTLTSSTKAYKPQMTPPANLPTQAPQPTLPSAPMAYKPQMTPTASLPTQAPNPVHYIPAASEIPQPRQYEKDKKCIIS